MYICVLVEYTKFNANDSFLFLSFVLGLCIAHWCQLCFGNSPDLWGSDFPPELSRLWGFARRIRITCPRMGNCIMILQVLKLVVGCWLVVVSMVICRLVFGIHLPCNIFCTVDHDMSLTISIMSVQGT
jgi:hypothetical protein